VRDTRIFFFLTLTLHGSSLACKSDESASKSASTREPAREAKPDDGSAPPSDESQSSTVEPTKSADDPQHADKLADLDALCKALDHDYIDGTLSDYYRGIEPRTEWGKAQRDAGNESIKPARLLEKAVADLAVDAEDPGIPHCRKLLDYIDDVE
jgi:hypothetical protein